MPRFGPGRFGPFEGRHFGGAGILHMILVSVLIAAAIVLIVWAISQMRHHDRARAQMRSPGLAAHAAPPPPVDGAIKEARLRYARGEMSREEFLQVSSDLGDLVAASAIPPAYAPAPAQAPAQPATDPPPDIA